MKLKSAHLEALEAARRAHAILAVLPTGARVANTSQAVLGGDRIGKRTTQRSCAEGGALHHGSRHVGGFDAAIEPRRKSACERRTQIERDFAERNSQRWQLGRTVPGVNGGL